MNFTAITGHDAQRKRLEVMLSGNCLPPTMLFSGIQGIGKRKIAKHALASLFCTGESRPCGKCRECNQIASGSFPDFVEMSPNERGVIPIGSEEKREPGTVRWFIRRLSMRPVSGKVAAIVDGIDRISEEGQNALLKSIEEPAPGVHMVLIASSRGGVLPTISSRAIEIAFNPLLGHEIEKILGDLGVSSNHRERAASISGGSVEAALLLSDEDVWEELHRACSAIAAVVHGRDGFYYDTVPMEKSLGREGFLDALIGAFREDMRLMVAGESAGSNCIWDDARIGDMEKLHALLKILLVIKRGMARNLNIRNALKGMLYSEFSGNS